MYVNVYSCSVYVVCACTRLAVTAPPLQPWGASQEREPLLIDPLPEADRTFAQRETYRAKPATHAAADAKPCSCAMLSHRERPPAGDLVVGGGARRQSMSGLTHGPGGHGPCEAAAEVRSRLTLIYL